MATQITAKTQYVKAANGVTFAYRRVGKSDGLPLVMQIHFRANMDFWDPVLVDSIAAKRPVIILDQAGVGRSDGDVAIDLLGFSMEGCAVQMVALARPDLIRKLIVAGSGPITILATAGRKALATYFARIYQRTTQTSGGEEPLHTILSIEGTANQSQSYQHWDTPNPDNSFGRLGELKMPVLITNGDDDLLYATRAAEDVNKFLVFDLQSEL
ncbi:hypothetical protein LTR08_004093 [Meristemomyces frigidus]|nr:hypothetical protein LTR08_004093 [Meristemomyces frigidus]